MASKKRKAKRQKKKDHVNVKVNIELSDKVQEALDKTGGKIEDLVNLQLNSFLNRRKILTLDDRFHFGQYEGQKVMDVMNNDPGYMIWLVVEQRSGKFDAGVVDACKRLALDLKGHMAF